MRKIGSVATSVFQSSDRPIYFFWLPGGDRLFFLALLKLVEIVGEAATRIPEATHARYPDIPWREIIGTRNRLIHGYDAVDLNILWEIVTADFPPLACRIRALLPEK